MRARLNVLALALSASFVASPALAEQIACSDLANAIVENAAKDVLGEAVKSNPDLQKLSGHALAMAAGRQFLTAERPDFKAYGYMLLLWYGGEEGRDLVAKVGPELTTEEDRAHLYFVMGLAQLRAQNAKTAATGRDYIRQMRDSGKVTFVTDEMWDLLIDKCRLPS